MTRLALALLAGLAIGPGPVHAAPATDDATVTHSGSISGVITDSKTGKPIADAIIVLQCTCLSGTRETRTNAEGIYMFRDLPPGTYTIQALSGQADVSKVTELPRGARFRANFKIDPRNELKRSIVVEASPIRMSQATTTRVSMDQMRNLPVGNSSRDFSSVVTSAARAPGRGRATGRTRGLQRWHDGPWNTEAYQHVADNELQSVADRPLSTFSIDVDTAAYSNARRFIQRGALPPADAVRIEELLNYFDYAYPEPTGQHPFSVSTEVGPCPWNAGHRLVRVGLRGKAMKPERTPPRNLVFLIDVSGSMMDDNKLPLVKRSLHLLVDQMREEDTVGIVVYAGTSGTALRPTSGAHKDQIREVIDELDAGGSTWGEGGIRRAYALAQRSFRPGGINRVILATDGDFNVGVSSIGGLTRLIERKRRSGVFLSVLGYGMYNLDDATMEVLADKGNGNYAYIDNFREARKVLVEEAESTLVTIAKDVKIQVEMNPDRVESYRLIGYVNRKLEDRDFDDDTRDAGEIGAGHTVTALYEVVPRGKTRPKARKLRYQTDRRSRGEHGDELMLVKLRYKPPQGSKSRLLEVAVNDGGGNLKKASADFRFAAAVAGFGMLLRDSKHRGNLTWKDVERLARSALGRDAHGYRREMVELVQEAAALQGRE